MPVELLLVALVGVRFAENKTRSPSRELELRSGWTLFDRDRAIRGCNFLEVVERAKPVAAAAPSLDERITTVLAEAQEALPFADLRAKCRVRAATLHERIGLLATAGRIVKTADGYRLTER